MRYGRSIANSNIAVGEILEVLSAAKEAVRNTYRQNDTITYVISIVNAGTLAYTGLTITDNWEHILIIQQHLFHWIIWKEQRSIISMVYCSRHLQ